MRSTPTTPDSLSGLFEFSQAKQHYYAGSSLIWLSGGGDAARAIQESTQAIAVWEKEADESRSLDDEALAQAATMLVDPANTAAIRAYDSWGWNEIGAVQPFPDSPRFQSRLRHLDGGEDT